MMDRDVKRAGEKTLAGGMTLAGRVILVGIFFAAVSAFAQQGLPKDPAATRAADLVELVKLDPTIKLDIRYAGTNNFLGKPVYKEARAFLQRPAADALLKAHREVAKSG